MSTRCSSLFALLTLAAALACSETRRSDESLGALVLAPDTEPTPIDVDKAARDAAELVRAASMPHRRIGALLGAHRLRATSEVEVTSGRETLEQLAVEVTVDLAEDGDYRAASKNSADYRREVLFFNDYMHLRATPGPYHRRAPSRRDEPAAVRDQIASELAGHLALLAPRIAPSEGAAAEVAGRPARTIAITLAEQRAPTAPQPAHRAWRESARVTAASGTITLDVETGAPLAADIRGEVVTVREGRELTIAISVTHAISDIGAEIAIALPDGAKVMSTPERSREVDERNELLRSIAPPAGAR